MSITSEFRTYADNAVSQGKHVLDNAQAQLNDVTGQANDLVGKANGFVSSIADKAGDAVTDLRTSAEKAVNLEAINSAVEPYRAQLKEYTSVVTDKVEALVSGVTNDKRVAALVETVQVRVVKPVQSLTGIGAKPATRSSAKRGAKPSPRPTKAAAAKPARRPAATRSAAKPASKPATNPSARKAPAKRATRG